MRTRIAVAAAVLLCAGVQAAGAVEDHPTAVARAEPVPPQVGCGIEVAIYQLLTQQQLTALQTQQAMADMAKTQIEILRTLQRMEGRRP